MFRSRPLPSRFRLLMRATLVGSMTLTSALALVVLAAPGCPRTSAGGGAGLSGPTTRPAVTKSLAEVGLDASALDRSADPCADFYKFTCGNWIKEARIPADRPRWARSFSVIRKSVEDMLHKLLFEDARSSTPTAAGRYFAACMDETSVEKAGVAPLQSLFAELDGIGDRAGLTRVIAQLHRHKIWAPFRISSEQDFKNATRMIGYIDQAGLGLPDRGYYLRKGKRGTAIRKLYVGHIERTMKLAGFTPEAARKASTDIMVFETQLAQVSKTRVQRRDPRGLYNKIDRAGVEKTVPSLDWSTYFSLIGQKDLNDVNVTSVKFLEGVEKQVKSAGLPMWRTYLKWQVVRSLASVLPKAFVDERFTLVQKLTGQKAQRPRWKRCTQSTNGALGDLVGKLFVARYFPESSKQEVQRMVLAISAEFARVAPRLGWMTGATLERALKKRKKMAYLIGYPSKWKKYDFAVGPSYAANVLAARAHDQERKLRRIGKPVDRDEWMMSAPTVNAYYHPLRNHMVYPAGILQPPFYNPRAAVAVNMGAMGVVVGHELTHGFDDKGSLFDADGNLSGWWEKDVRERFKSKAQCVVDQYSKYEVLPGLHQNGKLTLGENIADMGGVKLAFGAYRKLRSASPTRLVAGGFNEDQLFFLSLGQLWCNKSRPAFTRLLTRIDTHSNPRFRVIGSLSNLPEFARTFSCKAGTRMYPKKRCAVW